MNVLFMQHMAETKGEVDYEGVARELVRALRGRRSCAEMSRRAGYRSNIVQRWESGHSFPTAARFLAVHTRLRPREGSWLQRFHGTLPPWAEGLEPTAPATIAAFLQNLRGRTPVARIAERCGRNRFSVRRWFEGTAQPRLPDFLRLVDACSRRLIDLLVAVEDPTKLPSIKRTWQRLRAAREAAYEYPFSHAVLRALELRGSQRPMPGQARWLARRIGISAGDVTDALRLLAESEQLRLTRAGYRIVAVADVDTSHDPERAAQLKIAWTETALDRLKARKPGRFGYTVFAASKNDLERLRAVHLEYVRAMQDIIATSQPGECVGLYCAQLLDLAD